MALGFRRSQRELSPGLLEDSARSAYTLIESARIRCEQIADSLGATTGARAIHRDLGLAGYHFSSELPRQSRQRCVARAHAGCDAAAGDGVTVKLRKTFDDALGACDVIAAIIAEAPGDHAQIAHAHLMSALESLDSWLLVVAG